MRILTIVLAFLAIPFVVRADQETTAPDGALIQDVEISGPGAGDLSDGLRRDIDALVGARLDRQRLDALVARIEAEQPTTVAAARSIATPNDAARVIFMLARVSSESDLLSNINARYTVEHAEVTGVADDRIGQTTREALMALVGQRLDPKSVDQFEDRLKKEFRGHVVKRRVSRGTQPGTIRLVFELIDVERQSVSFGAPSSKLVYHEDLGWSGVLDIRMRARHVGATVNLAFSNKDDLVEEYSGVGVRFEHRNVGTERLGLSLGVSRYRQSWEPITLSALASAPDVPEPYRVRLTVEPLAMFSVTPDVRISGGISVTELESLERSPASQMASAALGSLSFDREWKPQDVARHRLQASYGLRVADTSLGSDLEYRSHVARVRYEVRHDHHTMLARSAIGRVAGSAPLFERFTLGDTATLRGWNKFDIAPIGGDRMLHQSIEYRYRGVALFLDTGSVWDADSTRRIRTSTGIGYHREPFFVTVGFPLNADRIGGMFMAGTRF